MGHAASLHKRTQRLGWDARHVQHEVATMDEVSGTLGAMLRQMGRKENGE
jgi:hypothetical protein